jgi:prepilin-type N-terminal cleavage/methylation domain-containing protein
MNKGFTLIEVIIYIALFSLLMGSAFVTAFQLIDNSGKLGIKNTIQEEGNFVMRKLNWALTGIQTITTPTAGTTPNLQVKKYDGNIIYVRLSANKIEIRESINGIAYLPITTDNVTVSNLDFKFISTTGSGPAGITATAIINEIPFTITKYLRK